MERARQSKVCAYCGGAGPFSREHLFTGGLLERTASSENSFQWLQRKRGFVEGDAVIRDVCKSCNNGPLSQLDGYLCDLYDTYFNKFVRDGESIRFQYRFDELSRWLIKTIYNSSRVHGQDVDFLSKCTQYILYNRQRPNGLSIFLQLVIPFKPSTVDREKLPESFKNSGEFTWRTVRICQNRSPLLQKYLSSIAVYRIVALNSYYFHVIIPKQDTYSTSSWKVILKNIQKDIIPETYRLKLKCGEMTIQSSSTTFKDAFSAQFQKNWRAYSDYFKSDT
jgi:hypothetical protein